MENRFEPGQGELSDYVVNPKPIGKGAYGLVHAGTNKRTGEKVALKKTSIDNQNEGIPSTTMREISILTELQHPNIVSLKDVVMTDTCIFFIQEFCNIDLRAYLLQLPESDTLSARQIKAMMYQILLGIKFCHSNRIIHRDLKPANILLSGPSNEEVKLADFGLARAFSIPIKPYTKDVVTLWYRSPELLLRFNEYATPVDIWSAGCIFAELATKKALFQGQSDQNQINEIFRTLGKPTEESWPGISKNEDFGKVDWPNYPPLNLRDFIPKALIDDQGLDLLYKMLEYEPCRRITAKSALSHPYFAELEGKPV